MPCLISSGGHVLEFEELPSRFGTSSENEIVVQEGLGVAPHHFNLREEAGTFILDSTGQGATTVNGHDVRRTSIRDGDRIQVGELMLIFSCEERAVGCTGWKGEDGSLLDAEAPQGAPPMVNRPEIQVGAGATPNSPSSAVGRSQVVSDALAEFPGATENPFGVPTPVPEPESAPASTAAAPRPPQGAFSDALLAQDPEGPGSASTTPPGDDLAALFAAGDTVTPDPGSAEAEAEAASAIDGCVIRPVTDEEASAALEQPAAAPPLANPLGAMEEELDLSAVFQEMEAAEQAAVAEGSPSAEVEADVDVEAEAGTVEDDALLSVFAENEPETKADEANDFQPERAQPIDVEIPALPEISDAEKSGSTVEADELPGGEIRRGAFGTRRPKPLPPIKLQADLSGDESGADDEADELETSTGRGWKKGRWGRRGRRKKRRGKDPLGVAERLAQEPKRPFYGLMLPWHQIAIFVCLVFATAGGYLAMHGQHYVEKYVGFLGLKSESQHSKHMRRLAIMNPEMVFTLDVERAVKIYKRWSAGEDWLTVGDMDMGLQEYAKGFSLTDLERVTFAADSEGRTLALISTKSDLKRRALIQDLGRGLLSLERVRDVPVHEGFVGRRTSVKFALLNPRTIVIGDPEWTMKFLSAPVPSASGSELEQPVQTLANAGLNWLGVYFSQTALGHMRNKLPEPMKPAADRLISYVRSKDATSGRLMARIGVDLQVDSDFVFEDPTVAGAFAGGWSAMASERLKKLKEMLGPNGKSLVGAQNDLAQCRVEAQGNRANLALAIANRWETLDSHTVKGTFLQLADAFKNQRMHAPPLISPEELEARETAHQIVHKYERGLAAGATELAGLNDIEAIVKKLASGVRGAGAYRNVTYRVPRAEKYMLRVVELLEWDDSGQVVVNTVRDPVAAAYDGKALVREDPAEHEAP